MLSCVNRTILAVLLVAAVLILSSVPVIAQTPRLEVRLDDYQLFAGVYSGWLRALITNPVDSVGGFRIFIQLDRPDIIAFVPTTLPHLEFDTNGSVIQGWKLTDCRSLSGTVYDARVVALADDLNPPPLRGFGPSSEPRLLFRLPFVVLPGTDTMTNPTVLAIIQTSMQSAFDFSTPSGLTIPWADTLAGLPYIDTVKIKVRNGAISIEKSVICTASSDVNGDGAVLTVADYVLLARFIDGRVNAPDSLYRGDLNGDCVVDSADLAIFICYMSHGISCLPQPFPHQTCCNPAVKICCQGRSGNVDCDPDDKVDISDLTALIDNLYVSFAPLCCFGEANTDGDPARSVDISDLTALLDYLYVSFTPPANCF